ncbi:hypothetical protein GCM10011494_25050 [Novosphingobium endophyticum]|uniref:GDT1 family protein n=1 Tax=Novosphingobium endophyticum TaxID=1955250 RepID=A0A916TT83_9SPHN|nr:hypothetical protein [Novosphingobium endophyticum]GGC05463.1 hypothetical protein GCM10011494_25050 [Novosphingobium endophyticum]
MPALYLTLVAVVFAGLGARDQVAVAGLALRQGKRPGLLIVAVLCACLTGAFAAWLATWMLPMLPPPARAIFAGIAIGFAGVESLLLAPRRNPKEPTNSLGAFALVLIAHQVTDAARFLIFGLSVGMAAPVASGAGGVLGGAALVAFAWGWPEFFERPAARRARRIVGALLVLVALTMFLSEFGIL